MEKEKIKKAFEAHEGCNWAVFKYFINKEGWILVINGTHKTIRDYVNKNKKQLHFSQVSISGTKLKYFRPKSLKLINEERKPIYLFETE